MALRSGMMRVLRLRTQQRRLAELEIEAVLGSRRRLQTEALELDAERRRLAERESQAARAGTLGLETLQIGRAYDDRLAAAEGACAVRLSVVEETLRAKRQEALRAHREERKFLRLDEIHRERDVRDAMRRAEQLIDEFLVARHARLAHEDHDGPG